MCLTNSCVFVIVVVIVTIGAETIGHGGARAHPLFVSGGHGGHTGGTGKAHQAQVKC